MANNTITLPAYTLTPRPTLISGVSDPLLQLLAPIVAYWVLSLFFHILDTYNWFAKYRLHTPAELLKRNHVTRYEVVRDVVVQQIIQTAFGLLLAHFDPIETMGKEEHDITLWAQRLRLAQTYIPSILTLLGIDALALSTKVAAYPQLAGILAGGVYSTPTAAAPWETAVAKTIYWAAIPAVQFLVAVLLVDTWQYFLHRAMHMNKFLYTTLHSRHHRLYVPYAFGALYNHPVEGFMLDTFGTGVAYLLTGMTVRQGMWFFTCSTIKTVDDHCGYAFPWDPIQHITSNNAAYHDIHHQSWGIKTNFSQPFFTFWDKFLNTAWTGGDVSARYQRGRIAAQKKVEVRNASQISSVVNSPEIDADKAKQQVLSSQRQVLDDRANGGVRILEEEAREEQSIKATPRRSTRRRTSGFDPKAISDRVAGSLHGRSHAILHADGAH